MKNIINKYPLIFEQYNGNPYGVNWGCPDGWIQVLDWLCGSIQSYIDNMNNEFNNRNIQQVKCTTVKEKFARFEFYYTGGDDNIDGMVEMAQHIANSFCQNCGSQKNVDIVCKHGWYSCLCNDCNISEL